MAESECKWQYFGMADGYSVVLHKGSKRSNLFINDLPDAQKNSAMFFTDDITLYTGL